MGGGEKTGKDLVQEFKFSLWDGDCRRSCCFQQFTARLVRQAPPGASLRTLKLERVCMPESEWWSPRPLPLTPRPRAGVGEGREGDSSPGSLGLSGSF